MKKTYIALLLSALSAVTCAGTVSAAQYTLTWKNEMTPGNENACGRKITGYPLTGPGTVIDANPNALRFPLGQSGQQVITEQINYSPPLGCSKIVLETFCAVKIDYVQENMQTITLNPCRSSTLRITDNGIFAN